MNCPAKGKRCAQCGKMNHFAKVCRSRVSSGYSRRPRINAIEEQKIYSVNAFDEYNNLPYLRIEIGGKVFKALVDSGSAVNILPYPLFKNLDATKPLAPPSTQLFAYNSTSSLPTIGTCDLPIRWSDHYSVEKFYVTNATGTPLLGYPLIKRFNIFNGQNVCSLAAPPRCISEDDPYHQMLHKADKEVQSIVSMYPQVFQGIGKLKGKQLEIHIDPSVRPVAQNPRRTPFAIRKTVEDEIQKMLDDDIIEAHVGPSEWVSPIVVVPKDGGSIRICVDMRHANKAVMRERHYMPVLEDILTQLNGCKWFTKLDLTKGYHQIELTEKSRPITTFATHHGLWRYKRLSFGVKSAAEVFQNIIKQTIADIPGVLNVSDDILIFSAHRDDHLRSINQVLQRLSECGLTANPSKSLFCVDHIKFFGHEFAASGVSVDQKKLQAIRDIAAPKSVGELRSLLGMINYCGRFIPHYSNLSGALRALLKKNTTWEWSPQMEDSFQKLKSGMIRQLGYFNPTWETFLWVDAGPEGLGALLTQKSRTTNHTITIECASKALSDVEKRYSQIEKEALAIFWAIKHFHLFVYGREFTVVTDHQPLVTIFNKPATQPSVRIEKWLMHLQRYDFKVEYRPGATNPADFLSRHPAAETIGHLSTKTESHVTFHIKAATSTAITLDDVRDATNSDATLKAVMNALETNDWGKHGLETYQSISSELSTYNGVLLRTSQVVLPRQLWSKAFEIAHKTHLGPEKTYLLLRESIWFPKMRSFVKEKANACLTCQLVSPVRQYLPMEITPTGTQPWENLSVDYYGPFNADHELILVVVDDFSRFAVCEVVKATSANQLTSTLNKVFSIFGVPKRIRSDNGPPFQAHELKEFLLALGIQHHRITPLWPQANGIVERFMKQINKSRRCCNAQHESFEPQLHLMVRNYNACPHSATGHSPFSLMFGRSPRTTLPYTADFQHEQSELEKEKEEKERKLKEKNKAIYDRRRRAQPKAAMDMEEVLLWKLPRNKADPLFHPEPAVVKDRNGSQVSLTHNGREIIRNESFIKPLRRSSRVRRPPDRFQSTT